MSSRAQPVPPANRSDKGPGDAPEVPKDTAGGKGEGARNLAEQGRQGNVHQNTTHQGHQQDR
jgi:hypothetical protein